MKSMVFGLAFAGLAMAVSGGARAMPADAGYASPDGSLTLVSGGCGPFAHRGPFGGCIGNFMRPRPVYRPRCWIVQTYYGPRRVCR